MFLTTRGVYHYQEFSTTILDRTSLVFSVQSCGNVHILLGSDPGTTHQNAYEITIGNKENTASYIKEEIGTSRKHEKETIDILSCDEMRTFWVSWDNGRIAFGKGADGQRDIVIAWDDPEPKSDIVQAYFDTGNDNEGHWEFISLDSKFI